MNKKITLFLTIVLVGMLFFAVSCNGDAGESIPSSKTEEAIRNEEIVCDEHAKNIMLKAKVDEGTVNLSDAPINGYYYTGTITTSKSSPVKSIPTMYVTADLSASKTKGDASAHHIVTSITWSEPGDDNRRDFTVDSFTYGSDTVDFTDSNKARKLYNDIESSYEVFEVLENIEEDDLTDGLSLNDISGKIYFGKDSGLTEVKGGKTTEYLKINKDSYIDCKDGVVTASVSGSILGKQSHSFELEITFSTLKDISSNYKVTKCNIDGKAGTFDDLKSILLSETLVSLMKVTEGNFSVNLSFDDVSVDEYTVTVDEKDAVLDAVLNMNADISLDKLNVEELVNVALNYILTNEISFDDQVNYFGSLKYSVSGQGSDISLTVDSTSYGLKDAKLKAGKTFSYSDIKKIKDADYGTYAKIKQQFGISEVDGDIVIDKSTYDINDVGSLYDFGYFDWLLD